MGRCERNYILQVEYLQVVIPTYTPHFPRVVKFLESLLEHCLDINTVQINFVVSDHEVGVFNDYIFKLSHKINIKIYSLKDLVKEIFNRDIDDAELLKKVGKYNFQSIKKFVGVYKVANPYAVLFDSEALAIRDFKMVDLFSDHFIKYRHIFYTENYNNEKFTNGIFSTITNNCLELIGEDKGLPYYFFEVYNWFFDKNILDDLFTYIERFNKKSLFDLLCEKYDVVFEIVLYNLFIYYHNDKYKYNFICINKELEEIMGKEEYSKYCVHKDLHTPFEFHIKTITNQKYSDYFSEFYSKRNLSFCKFGILNEKHYSPYMKRFIESTDDIIFLCTLWHLPNIILEFKNGKKKQLV